MAAGSVVERKGRHVQQATGHRIPLVVRLVERRSGKYLNLKVNVGGSDVTGDHLHHLVAYVAFAAGELVRSLQHRLRRRPGGDRTHQCDDRRQRYCFCASKHHYPPVTPTLPLD